MSQITQERLRELLHYEPETGVFTWRVSRGRLAKAGDVAGTIETGGYMQIRVDGVAHLAHRLAWLYMTGEMIPLIDHRDTQRSNNRWSNLRQFDKPLNGLNRRGANRNNGTGLLGVSKVRKGYTARLHGKHIGIYPTAPMAHAAYLARKSQHLGALVNV